MSGAYDNLFGPPKAWVDGISEETDQFLTDLADEIRARNREPKWSDVLKYLVEKFPDDAPKTSKTVCEAVRRRV